jgi:hypothetical protein
MTALDQLIKGTQLVATSVSLLAIENKELRRENVAKKARKQRKRRYIQQGGTLTMGEARIMMEADDINAQLQGEAQVANGKRRVCGNCSMPRHNSRTCKEPRVEA